MYRMKMFLTLALALALSGIGAAQERGWATAIAWSPDGETIAVGSTTGVWFFDNNFVEVGFVATPQLDGYPPTTLDWNAASELVAVANAHQRGGILVADAKAQTIRTHIKKAALSNVRWRPGEDLILAAAWADSVFGIIAWDALTGEEIYSFSDLAFPENNIRREYWAVCWLNDDQVAAINRYITMFDIAAGSPLNTLDTYTLSYPEPRRRGLSWVRPTGFCCCGRHSI